MGPGFVSPLDANKGTCYHLLMGSWIASTLNRRQTVASTKKGSDRASGSSLKRSRRGQKVQEVQKQCRNEFPKVHFLPKLDRPSLSFGTGADSAESAGFSKTFPPTNATDSLKLIQDNSTRTSP